MKSKNNTAIKRADELSNVDSAIKQLQDYLHSFCNPHAFIMVFDDRVEVCETVVGIPTGERETG